MNSCHKCGSGDVESYVYAGSSVIKCNSCGYDEGAEFEQFPVEKKSQKAKGRYTPYKTGGSGRHLKSK